jgi:hypothetical protein
MSQTPAMSAVEAATNLVVGFGLAIGLQAALFPVMGLTVTPVQSLKLGGAFTMASLLRSYVLRRVFERLARGRRP